MWQFFLFSFITRCNEYNFMSLSKRCSHSLLKMFPAILTEKNTFFLSDAWWSSLNVSQPEVVSAEMSNTCSAKRKRGYYSKDENLTGFVTVGSVVLQTAPRWTKVLRFSHGLLWRGHWPPFIWGNFRHPLFHSAFPCLSLEAPRKWECENNDSSFIFG